MSYALLFRKRNPEFILIVAVLLNFVLDERNVSY